MNSDTPRTDAREVGAYQVQRAEGDGLPLQKRWVLSDFARELERENAALHAERDLYFNTLAGAMFSGKLDDLTCGELKTAYDKHKAELAALRAELADVKGALEIATRSADDQMRQKREAQADNAALRETIETALKVYLSEPDSSADHTEIAHSMYAILKRAALNQSP